jgi:CheY-like chemotaxis protein
MNVLLVDDNRDGAEMLAAVLQIDGHTVHVTADGAAALRIAAEQPLDALLIDLSMPTMSGYELARQLRAGQLVQPAARLIALSGWVRASDKARAREAGFDHHLDKPVDIEALYALLRGNAP